MLVIVYVLFVLAFRFGFRWVVLLVGGGCLLSLVGVVSSEICCWGVLIGGSWALCFAWVCLRVGIFVGLFSCLL